MKVLPPETAPPSARIERRHAPRRGDYTTYRRCLRWEFGHGCAICLTHESDLSEHGAGGTALTWIEHLVPQSHDLDRSQTDEYANCFYTCKFCNRARGAAPLVNAAGQRLLDPCSTVWSARFIRQGDELLPVPQDPDAARTHRVYDIDDPRKRAMRQSREDILTGALRALRECPPLIAQLLGAAGAPGSKRTEFLHAARLLHEMMLRARRDLARFSVPPPDSDPTCSCPSSAACSLPAFLVAQLMEVSEDALDFSQVESDLQHPDTPT